MLTIKEEVKRFRLDDLSGDADSVVSMLADFVLSTKQSGYHMLEFDQEDRYLVLFGERLETFEEEESRKQEEEVEAQKRAEAAEQDALWDDITRALENIKEQ